MDGTLSLRWEESVDASSKDAEAVLRVLSKFGKEAEVEPAEQGVWEIKQGKYSLTLL